MLLAINVYGQSTIPLVCQELHNEGIAPISGGEGIYLKTEGDIQSYLTERNVFRITQFTKQNYGSYPVIEVDRISPTIPGKGFGSGIRYSTNGMRTADFYSYYEAPGTGGMAINTFLGSAAYRVFFASGKYRSVSVADSSYHVEEDKAQFNVTNYLQRPALYVNQQSYEEPFIYFKGKLEYQNGQPGIKIKVNGRDYLMPLMEVS